MKTIKLRPDSALSNLTEEQQAQLYDWIVALGCSKAQVQLAKPEPDGFGLTTHITTLSRFYRRYCAALNVQEIAESNELATQNPSSGALPLRAGAEDSMHHAAFQLSSTPLDTESFSQLSRWLTKQKSFDQKAEYLRIAQDHLALARDRLAFDREKYQFNAARAALNHHVDLGKILADDTLDNEDKILAARDKLFGAPAPSPVLQPSMLSVQSVPSVVNPTPTLNPNPSEP